MKKVLLAVFAICLMNLAIAQETAETRRVGPFTGIKVAEGIQVHLIKGEKESVKIEASGTEAENVITELSDKYLKIHMRDGRYAKRTDIKVSVTYVKLEKLSASSAGSIYSEQPIHTKDIDIHVSSAASVEVEVNSTSVTASASSAGEIELKGKTKSLAADASSAGEIDAYDLESQQVTAEASSAGSVKVSVVNDLSAHASTGGSVKYRGNPNKSNTNSSTGGSVKKSD